MNEKTILQVVTVFALICFVVGAVGPYYGIITDIQQAFISIITLPVFIMGVLLLWKYRDGEEDYPFMGY